MLYLRKLLITGISTLFLLAFVSCGAPRNVGSAQLPEVEVATVKKGRITQTVSVNGTLVPIPNHEAVIRPPFAGILARMEVAPNERVEAGQVVAKMSTRLLEGQVEQARADITAARLQVTQAQAAAIEQRAMTDSRIAQAQADLAAAEAALTNANEELVRRQKLLKDGLVSQKDWQNARLAVKQAEALVKADLETVKVARSSIQTEIVKQTEIAVARSRVENAEGRLSTALAQMNLSAIRSPIAGTVATVSANSGEMVDPSTTLLTVVDTTRLQFVTGIPTRDLPLIQPGEKVRFTTDSLPGKYFSGIVAGVGAQVDTSTGMIPATVRVENRSRLLRDDMIATGEIEVGTRDGLLVPQSAILTDPATGKNTVVTVGKDGVAQVVPVETGLPMRDEVEIKSGVQEGEWIAVSGQYALPDGTKVHVKVVDRR